jgi:septal ring factor EnvC (AmiA/AmiB activator)
MTSTTDTDLRDILINLDKKLDVYIAQNTEQMKSLESQITDLKKSTDTQFADIKKSTDTQFADIKVQLRSQDSRLWTFVTALIVMLVGFLTKLAFFPQT